MVIGGLGLGLGADLVSACKNNDRTYYQLISCIIAVCVYSIFS